MWSNCCPSRPKDPELREAAALLQRALNAHNVGEEEALWTQVIEGYGDLDKAWVPDVVRRSEGGTAPGSGSGYGARALGV